jgi:hypothetical protein
MVTAGRRRDDVVSFSIRFLLSGGMLPASAFCVNLSKVLHIPNNGLLRFCKFLSTLWHVSDILTLGNARLFLVDGKAKPKDNTNLTERSWRDSGPSMVSGGFPRAVQRW